MQETPGAIGIAGFTIGSSAGYMSLITKIDFLNEGMARFEINTPNRKIKGLLNIR